MLIAKKGNYQLEYKQFLGIKKKTTHTLEINKFIDNNTKIKICELDEAKNIVSCGNRLLETITSIEDIENINLLVKILYLIFETEEIDLEKPSM